MAKILGGGISPAAKPGVPSIIDSMGEVIFSTDVEEDIQILRDIEDALPNRGWDGIKVVDEIPNDNK